MSRDETLAFWIAAPGRGELRREELPAPDPQEVSVRALYSGVSRGTEATVFTGKVPKSEYERMRAPFQAGQFPGPVKYGYISIGTVIAGPDAYVGRDVFCLYPHQQRYVVPCAAVYALPDDVPPARGVLAANLETALNGLWDSGITAGDRVTVIGAGTLGCLVAWLASRLPGTTVELVDPNPHRAAIATALGVRYCPPEDATPDADAVFHTSGSGEGLALAMRVAGFEATVTELSWYGDRFVDVRLGEAFHARRLTLKSSQVGAIGATHRARWDLRRRMELAISLLRDSVVDVLINEESRFEDLPRTMERLSRAPGDVIMHRVRYD